MKKKKLFYALLEIIILIILISLLVLAYNAHQAMKLGQELLKNGDYVAAQEAFSKAGGHEKSPDYAKYARAIQQVQDGKLDDAQTALGELGNFEDAASYLKYVSARKAQDAKDWQTAVDGYTASEALLDSAKRVEECRGELNKQQYREAADLYAQGDLEKAGQLYTALGDYEDSKELAAEIQAKMKTHGDYTKAMQLQSEGKLQEAYDIFSALGDYEDSASRSAQLKKELAVWEDYQAADKLEQSGDLEGARLAFLALNDYSDSAQRAAALNDKQNEAIYQSAVAAEKDGKISEAYAGYVAVGKYKDAPDKASAILKSIQDASDKVASAQQAADDAENALNTTSRDDTAALAAAQKAADDAKKALEAAVAASPKFDWDSVYQFALKLIDNGQLEQASILLASLKDNEKAQAKLMEVDDELAKQKAYEDACIAVKNGELFAAQSAFEGLGNYKDSVKQLENIKKILKDDPDAAITASGSKKQEFVDAEGVTHEYQIFEGCKTWDEARQYCQRVGGHLATLTTEEENRFVYNFIAANGYRSAYFGLSDIERTGAWAWVTGEPFDYANWHQGEPNRLNNEKYGMYLDKFSDPTWNDCHFGEGTSSPGAPFICEWDY